MPKIIIKIGVHSYNLLRKIAKGDEVKKGSGNIDGCYYISIEKELYDQLIRLNADFNKAIFYNSSSN